MRSFLRRQFLLPWLAIHILLPVCNGQQGEKKLPSLGLKNTGAVTFKYCHIVRIPSDGATLVHILDCYVDRELIAIRFTDSLPRGDQSLWPKSWCSILRLDSSGLSHLSPTTRRVSPVQTLPLLGTERPQELTRTSGYSFLSSAFSVRDSRHNHRDLTRLIESTETSDRVKKIFGATNRLSTISEAGRRTGAPTRNTRYRYRSNGSLELMRTKLHPYPIDLSRQGYSPPKVLWHSPARNVEVHFSDARGSTPPQNVTVSLPWTRRLRLPIRQSIVFDVRPHPPEAVLQLRGRYEDNKQLAAARNAHYMLCRSIKNELSSEQRKKAAAVAERRLEQTNAASMPLGTQLSNSLDVLSYWRSSLDESRAAAHFTEYLEVIDSVLPDGISLPLGFDILQLFKASKYTTSFYDEHSTRIVKHAIGSINRTHLINELLLLRENCFFPATCLRILRKLRALPDLSAEERLDIAYLEASLMPLCLSTLKGMNTNWDCVAQELRLLKAEVLSDQFPKMCEEIVIRANAAATDMDPGRLNLRKRMIEEILSWSKASVKQWNATGKGRTN